MAHPAPLETGVAVTNHMPMASRFGPFDVRPGTYRAICAVLAVACLAVGGTGIYMARQWNRSTAVGLSSVLEDFRAASPDAAAVPETSVAPGAASVPAAPADPAIAPLESTPAAVVAAAPANLPAAAPVPASTPAAPAAPTTTTAPPGPAPFERPAEGVYTYAASGGEKLSVGGVRHSYPAQVFAAVTHTACGYQIEVRVLKEHVDRFEMCLDGTRLALRSSAQRISFFGQTDEGAFVCDPPGVLLDRADGPGATHAVDCTAAAMRSNGTATRGEDVTVTIDGAPVAGHTIDWRWSASGTSSGGGRTIWVFDDDGLPLSIERHNATTSSTIIGPASLDEDVTFTLRSRNPQR